MPLARTPFRRVAVAIHGGRAPGPRCPARAFARIEDTLSVLDKGTALTHLSVLRKIAGGPSTYRHRGGLPAKKGGNDTATGQGLLGASLRRGLRAPLRAPKIAPDDFVPLTQAIS